MVKYDVEGYEQIEYFLMFEIVNMRNVQDILSNVNQYFLNKLRDSVTPEVYQYILSNGTIDKMSSFDDAVTSEYFYKYLYERIMQGRITIPIRDFNDAFARSKVEPRIVIATYDKVYNNKGTEKFQDNFLSNFNPNLYNHLFLLGRHPYGSFALCAARAKDLKSLLKAVTPLEHGGYNETPSVVVLNACCEVDFPEGFELFQSYFPAKETRYINICIKTGSLETLKLLKEKYEYTFTNEYAPYTFSSETIDAMTYFIQNLEDVDNSSMGIPILESINMDEDMSELFGKILKLCSDISDEILVEICLKCNHYLNTNKRDLLFKYLREMYYSSNGDIMKRFVSIGIVYLINFDVINYLCSLGYRGYLINLITLLSFDSSSSGKANHITELFKWLYESTENLGNGLMTLAILKENLDVVKYLQTKGYEITNYHLMLCFFEGIKLNTDIFAYYRQNSVTVEESRITEAIKSNDLKEVVYIYQALGYNFRDEDYALAIQVCDEPEIPGFMYEVSINSDVRYFYVDIDEYSPPKEFLDEFNKIKQTL